MNAVRLFHYVLTLVLACISASAATLTWNYPAGGAWNEATNWTPNQIPGTLDTAVIDLAGTYRDQGLFEIHADSNWSYGYSGPRPSIRNEGTLRKVGGSGFSSLLNLNFSNTGQIEVQQGRLNLQRIDGLLTGTAHVAQDARLTFVTVNLTNSGPATFTGPGRSIFESGNLWLGGTVQPTGLILNPAVTVRIHANGTAPGTQHDRLRVTGPVDLGGASLQIPSATGIGFGQSALFLENDGTDPILGTFAGRDEGSLFDVASRLYRLRYKTGSGNDASLIRDDGAIVLSPRFRLTNGLYRVVGLGTNFVNYRIEASTNLTDWIDLGTVPSNGGGEFQFDDTESDQLPVRLYRAIGP